MCLSHIRCGQLTMFPLALLKTYNPYFISKSNLLDLPNKRRIIFTCLLSMKPTYISRISMLLEYFCDISAF